MLAWETLILNDDFTRYAELGLWLEPTRHAPFMTTRRHDGQEARIIGAAPYGEEARLNNEDWMGVLIEHREKHPLIATGETRLYLIDRMAWVPIKRLVKGDVILIPEIDKGLPSVKGARVMGIRKMDRPLGLEQTPKVRGGTLVCRPRGSFATPCGFVTTQLDRLPLLEREEARWG